MTTTVAIADDHVLFADGVSRALDAVPDIEVLGTASNGRELVELLDEITPDVLLIDLEMPELDGLVARVLLRSEVLNEVRFLFHGLEFPASVGRIAEHENPAVGPRADVLPVDSCGVTAHDLAGVPQRNQRNLDAEEVVQLDARQFE